MKAKESLAIWFDELTVMGESTDISIIIEENQVEKEYIFSHGKFDAISGFIRNIGYFEGLKTKLNLRGKPKSKLKYFLGFIRYSLRIPFKSAKWNKFNKDWRNSNHKFYPRAVCFFDKDETLEISFLSKKMNVSLNSLLLYLIDEVIAEKLNSRSKRVWLIPVNVRDDIDENNEGNEVGFIDAIVSSKCKVETLHRQIKNRISRYEHLGGILGVGLGVVLGEYLLRRLVNVNKYLQVRTGVFTNLGSWDAKSKEGLRVYGFPPVLETQPVGVGALTWCGRLSISIHTHPCLMFDNNDLRDIIEKIKMKISEMQ